MRRMLGMAAGLALGLGAVPGLAQSMSDQELLQRFQTQRDAFRSVEESGLGRTRGLTMITVDDVGGAPVAATETPATAPTGGSEGVTVSGGGGGGTGAGGVGTGGLQPLVKPGTTTAEAQVVPVTYGKLAPELQVNVRIAFAFDSAALSDDQKPKLAQLCRVMKESDIGRFQIVGHTDASGTAEYNERLSVLRAQEVQRYLVNDCGIAADRLQAVGFGERFLFNEGDPRAAENRRVEFQALS